MATRNFGLVRVVHDAPTRETDMNANNSLSIEFFPPKTPEGAEKLRVVRQALYPLKPQFCSVTYGAGGSTQAGTISTLKEILSEGMSAASHFSCIGATRDSVRQRWPSSKPWV